MVLESVIFGMLAAIGRGVSDFVTVVVAKKLGILRTAVGVHVASVAVTTAYLLAAAGPGQLLAIHWSMLD